MEHKNFQEEENYDWIMEVSEPNQLRKAVNDVKLCYIRKLIDAGILSASEEHSCTLTVSQLKSMVTQNKIV
ncbi:hypothetical protein LF817_18405 [Halobacillus sp. A1]|uniref:Uncharacterized protein n=1 Tax=Halobacillus campisalis TaxID=435909 RepID=A0ABW2K249_9BACI|nr:MULTISPECIES: hypothetical protein [Halobacillus]MCP3033302.1 hypothetical protein [Halobacillus sp. A1]